MECHETYVGIRNVKRHMFERHSSFRYRCRKCLEDYYRKCKHGGCPGKVDDFDLIHKNNPYLSKTSVFNKLQKWKSNVEGRFVPVEVTVPKTPERPSLDKRLGEIQGEGEDVYNGTDKVTATVAQEEEQVGASIEQAVESVENTVEEGTTAVPENPQIGDQVLYSDVTDTEDEPIIRPAVPVGRYSMFAGDAVSLFIGGVKFETSGQTLRHDPNSLFAKALNNNEIVDGTLLFDRDALHFRHVINHLRNGLYSDIRTLPDDVGQLTELLSEAQYYQMSSLIRVVISKLERLTIVTPFILSRT